MASLSTSGIGSGIDVNSLVSQLIAADRDPSTKRLDKKEAILQAKLSAVGTLKSAVSDFRAALSAVNGAAKFQSMSASISNDALFSVTTTSVAQAGDYSIQVDQLAQAQKLITSDTQRFGAVTDIVGSGTLTFSFGATTGGTGTPPSPPIGFTNNPAKAAKTVTIDATNNTLAGMRDAINNANMGVRANILYDGTGYRLSLGSADMGADNGLKISVADIDGNSTDQTGLSRLAYDPTGTKNMTETVAAQNALLKVDGLDVTSASNSVVGVVPGVTIKLKSKSATPATLTIAQDNTSAAKGIESFVAGYNKLASSTQALTFYNASTGEKGALASDSTVRSLTNQVRSLLISSITGTTGSILSLADAGINFQKDGTLKVDSDKLQTALADNPQAVTSLFSRVGRTSGDPLISYSSAASTSTAGTHAINITQVATQGQYRGATLSAENLADLTVGGAGHDNAAFKIKVNGVQSGAINLTQKTYASGADLAAELQSQINADSALQTAGASVSVSFSTDHFVFKSNNYGASSKVQFTEVGVDALTTLGFDANPVAAGTTITNGQDVAGTIGGVAATGSGRKLTGAGIAAGIAVEVFGESTGPRGAVSLSNGIAQQLDTLIGKFLDSDGPLNNRTTNINQQITQVGTQRAALNTRMNTLEARYRTQFLAMDTLMSRLTATGSFLAQQFNSSNSSNN